MRTIKEALMWRAAIKEYNKEAILSDEEVGNLLDAVRMAPSSYGLQPFKLIVIKSAEMREKLKAVSYNQSQVTDASHFVVFVSKVKEGENDVAEFVQRIIAVRGVTEESLSGYAGMMNGALGHMNDDARRAWAGKQAYLGLGVLLTAAALADIDASPMEGFDAGAYDEILDLKKDGYTTAVVCALGKRVDGEKYAEMPKVRKTEEEFVKVI